MIVEVFGGIFSGSLALLADAGHMLTVGGIGLAVNIAAASVLHAGSKHSLDVDGAFKHVLADLRGRLVLLFRAQLSSS